MARERRTYTDKFKQKIVELDNSGKTRAELVHESININSTGSFNIDDNCSDEEKELIKLRKEN